MSILVSNVRGVFDSLDNWDFHDGLDDCDTVMSLMTAMSMRPLMTVIFVLFMIAFKTDFGNVNDVLRYLRAPGLAKSTS